MYVYVHILSYVVCAWFVLTCCVALRVVNCCFAHTGRVYLFNATICVVDCGCKPMLI